MISSQINTIIIENPAIYRLFVSLIYVILTYSLVILFNFFISKVEKRLKKTEYTSNVALLLTIKEPTAILIWGTCLYKILMLYKINLEFLFNARIVLISLTVLWLSLRFITRYVELFIQKKEKNKENIDYNGINFVKKLSQISCFVIIFISCLGKIGISVQSLAAISGAGSLVVGLAAKDLLANVFGGLMIYMDKPFSVGDWIYSPDRDVEGDVEEIGWRKTKILTFAKTPIYVSNSIFTDIIIENKGRMKSRRINEIIPLRYMDIAKVEKIVKEIKEMLTNHININHRLITIVALDSITPAAVLNLKLYVFTNTIEWVRHTEIKQDILIKVIEIIQSNGGELAYDTKEIFLRKEKQQTFVRIEGSDVF